MGERSVTCSPELFKFLPVIACMFIFRTCMSVCIRGGPLRPLHRDPQWSVVLPLSLIIPSAIPHLERSAGFCTWERRNSHLVP
jgi:hypothetical protein